MIVHMDTSNPGACYACLMTRFATVVLLVAAGGSSLAAQTLRERVREFGREHPNAVYRFPRSPADFAGPLTIEGMTRHSDVVVQGRLAKGDTRLIADQVVVTDYSVVEPVLIAGRLPIQQIAQPGAPTPQMTVSLWGGSMFVDGVRVEAEGGYAVKPASTYILFLQPARQSTLANNYEPYDDAIFEIDGTRIVPPFKNAEHVFSGAVDWNVNSFVARIRNAAQGQ